MAKAAAATGTLQVAGVAGYEGSIGGSDEAQRLGLITAFCRRLRALADRLEDVGEEPIVTAGGSAFFDVVTAELTAGGRGPKVILRSGAYLTHDHGFYRTLSPASRGLAGAPALRPALELWTQVLSSPEPGLALLGAGRRDVGFDQGLPVPLRVIRRPAARGGGPDLAARPDRQPADGAQRPARVPAAGPGCRTRARRPGEPGHLAPLHHLRQVARDSGSRRCGPGDRYGARLFLTCPICGESMARADTTAVQIKLFFIQNGRRLFS